MTKGTSYLNMIHISLYNIQTILRYQILNQANSLQKTTLCIACRPIVTMYSKSSSAICSARIQYDNPNFTLLASCRLYAKQIKGLCLRTRELPMLYIWMSEKSSYFVHI